MRESSRLGMSFVEFDMSFPESLIDALAIRASQARNHVAVSIYSFYDNSPLDLGDRRRHVFVNSKYWLLSKDHGDLRAGARVDGRSSRRWPRSLDVFGG